MKDGLRGRKDVRAQLGVDAVGGNHNLGFRGDAVGEFDTGDLGILLEADSTVAGWTIPAGRLAASSSMKSARCMPKVAFQPEASDTCTGAIGVPSWRK